MAADQRGTAKLAVGQQEKHHQPYECFGRHFFPFFLGEATMVCVCH
jgi:hypothetical protein